MANKQQHSQEKTNTVNEEELDFTKRTCDPCKFEHKQSTATGFCQSCKEYFCKECELFHKRFQATRAHKIVHGMLMPHLVKKSMYMCEYHNNNSVKYFCKDHSDVICTDCKEEKHSICKEIVSISFFAGEEIEKENIELVSINLRNICEDFENVKKLRQQDIEDLHKQKEKCVETINKIRLDFNKHLANLESEIKNNLSEIHSQEVKGITEQTNMCTYAIKALQCEINKVANVITTEDNVVKFAAYIKALKTLTAYKKVLKEVKCDATKIEINIFPNKLMLDSINGLVTMGDIRTNITQKTFHIDLKDLKKENMRMVETVVYSVRMQGDDEEHDCEITGSSFLDDGSLVICDKHNYKVKLLDRNFNCKYDIKLSGAPWDVAVVHDKWLITSLPFVKKLQFLNADIFEGIKTGRTIEHEKMCWGIAVSKNEIFVSCHDNPGDGTIVIFDKKGHAKRTINATAEDVSYPLELPSYIAVSVNGNKIFVADGDFKRTITCLAKENGAIIYDCSVNQFGYSKQANAVAYQNPWSFKIIVDEEDYVLANTGVKDMIVVVSDVGTQYLTLLRNTEELFGPHTISYRASDATLMIGLWDQIQTFKFKEI